MSEIGCLIVENLECLIVGLVLGAALMTTIHEIT